MTRPSKAALLLREALSRPETELLDLAAALIESVEKERAREDVRAAWASAAKRRVAEVRLGVVKPVPWDDAEKRIFDTE